MGMAQIIGKQPGMTGTLKVRYLRPSPLNTELQLEAWLDRVEGRKTIISAEIRNGDSITATCEALFIRPRDGLGLTNPEPQAEAD
jgi:acyl-CoA thioesterase FadM